ncbi:MAG: TIM barrel protein [Candidatus Helarchaeota archaeon]
MVKLLLGIDRSLYHVKIRQICELAERLELDGLEIQPEHPDIFKLYPQNAIPIINKNLASFNFEISFHTPIKDINIASYNPTIRKSSIKELQKSVDFANRINAKHIVTHAGKNSFKTRSYFSKKYENIALGFTIEAFRSIDKLCRGLGRTLSVENMTWSDWRLSSKIKYLQNIFKEIPGLKLTLDIDHAIERSRRYVDKFIEVFKEKIISSHTGNVKKNITHIIKLLDLPFLKYLVLEPHSLTYQVHPKIFELIETNISELKKLI